MYATNLTCALTRSPIYQGDKVRLLLLGMNPRIAEQTAQRNFITAAWAPLTLPIAMTYKGHGEYRLIDPRDWRADMFLSDFASETPMSTAFASFETAVQMAYHGNMSAPLDKQYCPDDDQETAPVGIMVMHEDAYQRLSEDTYDIREDCTIEMLSDQMLNSLKILEDINPVNEFYALFMDTIHDEMGEWMTNHSTDLGIRVYGLAGPSPCDVIRAIHAWLKEGQRFDHPKIKDALRATAQMRILTTNMTAMGIPFGPTSTSPREFNIDLYRELHKIGNDLYERD